MTAAGARIQWNNSENAPIPPYPLYDSYRHPHDHRGPPPTHSGPPPPYHRYPPHGAPSQAPSHYDFWYEQQQRGRAGYGLSMHEGGPPAHFHGEGRQGPPPSSFRPPLGYLDGRIPRNSSFGAPPPPDSAYYRRDRPELYPPPYRTPPPSRREAAVVQASSFSSKESKEDAPQVLDEGGERSDWQHSEQGDGNGKQGDPLSLLAKVSSAMAPPRSRSKDAQLSGEREAQENESKAKAGVSVTSPSKAGASSPLQRRLRSSPIITPNSMPPQQPRHAPPPPHVREAHPHPGGNTITPKPITPTGSKYFGPPPNRAYRHGYEDPRVPPGYPPPSGMPPRVNYGPPPGPYSSGYDSRSGSWEQAPPAVVEERNSFDSLESYGARHYHADYSRSGGNRYPPYPPPMDGWHPEQQRPGGSFPSPARWGYDQGPPPYSPHSPHTARGPYSPPQQYYNERGVPPYQRPSPLTPPGYAPYSFVQQPNMDEKTVLHKKFSWKHFPELERFLIDNRDDYLKFSSRNYTIEQKQFNNMLTERLIELAEKHSYVFDPEEFNFVSIRDRIRCYYKSYVQTSRKRGLMLPTDKAKVERKDTDEVTTSGDGEAETHNHGDVPFQDKEERE